ncbi:Cyclase OS=Streptomyces microflavus OX=1919 GN=G3I39_00590 PE=4 SV=1 [Streptomyces microflavus]
MTDSRPREVEHEITVSAPAAEVYRLIAEVENWPRIFPPTIYVDHIERSEGEELIRIWATANGEAKNWTSRRFLDREAMRITFRQQVSTPPVATMGGTWIIEPLSATESRIRLQHDYTAVDDDHPAGLAWIEEAVDRDSPLTLLAALKTNVELRRRPREELTFAFEDTVEIAGSAKDAYGVVDEAKRLWSRAAAARGGRPAHRGQPRAPDPGDGHPRQGRLRAGTDEVVPGAA